MPFEANLNLRQHVGIHPLLMLTEYQHSPLQGGILCCGSARIPIQANHHAGTLSITSAL